MVSRRSLGEGGPASVENYGAVLDFVTSLPLRQKSVQNSAYRLLGDMRETYEKD